MFQSLAMPGRNVVFAKAADPEKKAPSAPRGDQSSAPQKRSTATAQPQRTPVPNSPQAPVIVATLRDTFPDHTNGGKAIQGDVINYSVAVTNTGDANATSVVFNDTVDVNTSTLVPLSPQILFTMTGDTYSAIGNVRIDTSTIAPGSGKTVLENDTPNGATLTGFGATLALRRTTLAEIGGFDALKDCLADDYWLAERARSLGLHTVLSPVMVATDVIEPTFTALWLREMRWLRTIRSVNPFGFGGLFITFTSPWLLTGALLAHNVHHGGAAHPLMGLMALSSTVTGVVARVLLHARSARFSRTFWRDLPLVPLRE